MNPDRIYGEFFAPPLQTDDERPFAALEALERLLPGVRLDEAVTDSLKCITVTDRRAFVAEAVRRKQFPALSTGDGPTYVTIDGTDHPPFPPLGELPFLHVRFKFPAMYADRAADALATIGDICDAWHGIAVRDDAWEVMGEQRYVPGFSTSPPLGLPFIKLYHKLPSMYSPMYVGWLNYWSPETAARFNFPEGPGFDELRARAKKTPGGAWLVQLTDEPLDMGNPAHVDVLRRAYDVTGIGSGRV